MDNATMYEAEMLLRRAGLLGKGKADGSSTARYPLTAEAKRRAKQMGLPTTYVGMYNLLTGDSVRPAETKTSPVEQPAPKTTPARTKATKRTRQTIWVVVI